MQRGVPSLSPCSPAGSGRSSGPGWGVAGVRLAGMGRTVTYAYIGSAYGEQSEQLRRKMLIIKHVVLFTVFGLGTWWQYILTFK